MLSLISTDVVYYIRDFFNCKKRDLFVDAYKYLVQQLINKYDTQKTLRDNRTDIKTVSLFGHQSRYDLKTSFPLLTLKHTSFRLILGELLWFLTGSTDDRKLRELSLVPEGSPTIWSAWAVDISKIKEMGFVDQLRTDLFRRLDWLDEKDFQDLDEAYLKDQKNNTPYENKAKVLDEKGISYPQELGPIYQKQWLRWGKQEINQINHLITQLKTNPYSRRHIVSAWNVEDLPSESMSPQENVLNGKMALAPCHTMFQFYVEDKKTADGEIKKHLSCQLYQR